MKSPLKKKPKGEPATNRDAHWHDDSATDAHNKRQIDLLLEQMQAIQDYKERIRELEAEVENLQAELRRYA